MTRGLAYCDRRTSLLCHSSSLLFRYAITASSSWSTVQSGRFVRIRWWSATGSVGCDGRGGWLNATVSRSLARSSSCDRNLGSHRGVSRRGSVRILGTITNSNNNKKNQIKLNKARSLLRFELVWWHSFCVYVYSGIISTSRMHRSHADSLARGRRGVHLNHRYHKQINTTVHPCIEEVSRC